jgi:LacI family transcriptional regulator
MAKPQTVTSTDVARQAGVSRATVSAVLNGTQGNIRVSEETHRRVLAVAAALGYSPHPAAQALRRQRSRTIAFVPRTLHATEFGHPIAYQLGLHAGRAAARLGYHVIEVSPEPGAAGHGAELIDFLLSRRPDGVIFDAPTTPHMVEATVARGIPVVQLIRPQFAVATPTIVIDAAQGITDGMDHLVALGHRRIAFLGTDDPHIANRSRLEYFLAALSRHALAVPDEYVLLGNDYTIESGVSLMRTLLHCSPLPTALFAAGEFLAIGALRALHEARLWVPDAMSLISFDAVYAPILYPPITSVSQPLREVAGAAVTRIIERIEGGADAQQPPAHIVLPTHLNIRASTRPPADEVLTVSLAARVSA